MQSILTPDNLNQLKDLSPGFHQKIGDELYERMYQAFPDLHEHESFSNKGLLWWILHNQLEVIGRTERCKGFLLQLIEEKSPAHREATLQDLSAALHHLKQNLIFLIGELSSNANDSFYVLDNALSLYALNIEGVRHSISEVIAEPTPKPPDAEIYRRLDVLYQLLQADGYNQKLLARTIDVLGNMLSSADRYYLEIDGFILSEENPTSLLYHFRRVTSAGMHLLSVVILVETVIASLTYSK